MRPAKLLPAIPRYLVVGLNRWALRFAADAVLMTDEHPQFRLDLGDSELTAHVPVGPWPEAPAAAARPWSNRREGGRR